MYGVERHQVFSALRHACLRYVLTHRILYPLDDLPPVREIEWRIDGTKYCSRYRLKGTDLVQI